MHLAKDPREGRARDVLLKILNDEKLVPGRAMGWAADLVRKKGWLKAEEDQKVVCFTEVPLGNVGLLVQDIEGRSEQFRPYGLVFDKQKMRLADANPVWYVDRTIDHDWTLATAMDELVKLAAATAEDAFLEHPAARVFPFVEAMATWRDGQREFWWEREWRVRGAFLLSHELVAGLLAPEEDHPAFANVAFVSKHLADPAWEPERIADAMRQPKGSGLSPLPRPASST